MTVIILVTEQWGMSVMSPSQSGTLSVSSSLSLNNGACQWCHPAILEPYQYHHPCHWTMGHVSDVTQPFWYPISIIILVTEQWGMSVMSPSHSGTLSVSSSLSLNNRACQWCHPAILEPYQYHHPCHWTMGHVSDVTQPFWNPISIIILVTEQWGMSVMSPSHSGTLSVSSSLSLNNGACQWCHPAILVPYQYHHPCHWTMGHVSDVTQPFCYPISIIILVTEQWGMSVMSPSHSGTLSSLSLNNGACQWCHPAILLPYQYHHPCHWTMGHVSDVTQPFCYPISIIILVTEQWGMSVMSPSHSGTLSVSSSLSLNNGACQWCHPAILLPYQYHHPCQVIATHLMIWYFSRIAIGTWSSNEMQWLDTPGKFQANDAQLAWKEIFSMFSQAPLLKLA